MDRLVMEELAGTTKIRINPTRLRDIPMAAFLFVWLIGWAFGEVFALTTLFSAQTPWFVIIFLVIWLTGWTVGGAFAIAHLVRMIGGREQIEVGRGMVKISKSFVLFKLVKQYDTFRISDMHVNPKNKKKWNIINSGLIQFRYAEKDIRFGNNLTSDESYQVMSKLREHRDLSENNFR